MVGDTLVDVDVEPLLGHGTSIFGGALLGTKLVPLLLLAALGSSALFAGSLLGVTVGGDVLLKSSVLVEVLDGAGCSGPLARGGAVVVGSTVLEVLVAEGHTRGVGFRHVADAALADRGRWVKEWGSVDWVSTCVSGRRKLRWGDERPLLKEGRRGCNSIFRICR